MNPQPAQGLQALIQPPRTQGDTEPAQAYGTYLLLYIAGTGTGLCTLDQLKTANQWYPLVVWKVEVVTAEASARMQRRITKEIARREATIAQWFAQNCPQNDFDTPEAREVGEREDRSQDAQPDPRDQAIRMMRAALMLIQDPGTTDEGKGGGSRVPVSPRPPKFPPSNSAQVPDFQF